MFGLENASTGGDPLKGDDEFELETDVKDVTKRKKVIEDIGEQMQTLKKTLQQGESEGAFQKLGLVLHGYVAALKVIDRVKPE